MIKPKPEAVDELVMEYAAAQKLLHTHKQEVLAAGETADDIKGRLVAMVQLHGHKHAEKSMRLEGARTKATVTVGTRTTVDPDAVETMRAYLEKQEQPELTSAFFRQHVSYSLVETPQEVLRTLDLGTRLRNRLAGLLGLCFRMVTNSPSLKIDIPAE